MLAAAGLCAVAGAAATAEPGGEQRALAPTASLASNGAAEAPGPLGPGGGVDAPAEAPVAEVPVEEFASAPPEAPPAPVESADAPLPVPEAVAAPEPAPVTGVADPKTPREPPPSAEVVTPPTEAEALETSDKPLVPVGVLSAPVAAADDSAPLIDISPTKVDAPALGRVAQAEEEGGEVVIPVPPEDLPDEPADDVVPEPDDGRQPAAGGQGLALTGRDAWPTLLASLLLLCLGVSLRMSSTLTGPSRARA